jgi:hypothetical protein
MAGRNSRKQPDARALARMQRAAEREALAAAMAQAAESGEATAIEMPAATPLDALTQTAEVPEIAPLATTRRTQRPRRRLSFGLVALLVLAIVVDLVAGIAVPHVTSSVAGIQVPALTGLTLDEALAQLESLELTAGAVTYDPSSAEPTWTVIAQNPIGGEVDPGTAVDIVLAGGAPVTVPDVGGRTPA